MLQAFQAATARVAADHSVRCVVITGKGKNFCGGANLASGRLGEAQEGVPANERLLKMYSPFLSVLDLSVPVIGALQGHAIGGGLGLALVCDLRVCLGSAQYGSNFVMLGLHPGMATTYLLPRLVGIPKASELLLTGRLIDGVEASRVGLCNYAADTPEGVLLKAQELAREIARCAPVAVRWTKKSLYRHSDWNPRAAAWDEAQLQSRTAETDDFREGAKALLDKRAADFKGR